MSILLRLIFVTLCFSVFAIKAEECPSLPTYAKQAEHWQWLKVEVVYVETEGGFYGLRGVDGQHYLPLALNDLYQQEGLTLQVLIEKFPERKSFFMWGQVVRIHYIVVSCQ